MKAGTVLALLVVLSANAAPVVVPGDVIATSSSPGVTEDGQTYLNGTLVVFGRDGQPKGALAVFSEPPLSDAFVRDGIIYVATRYPPGIQRFNLLGQQLPPLTTQVENVNFLSPGPNGGILAVNVSGVLSQFASGGSLVHFRDYRSYPPASAGVDLALDGCTVYWGTGGVIVRWNGCTHSEAEIATPSLRPDTIEALRLLSDGSFLVSMKNVPAPILRLDAGGKILKTYSTQGQGLALDIDGTSFWTNEFGWITRVDIATGTVLSRTFHGRTWGLAVLGEPRAGLLAHSSAAVPLHTPAVLALLAAILTSVALHRIR